MWPSVAALCAQSKHAPAFPFRYWDSSGGCRHQSCGPGTSALLALRCLGETGRKAGSPSGLPADSAHCLLRFGAVVQVINAVLLPAIFRLGRLIATSNRPALAIRNRRDPVRGYSGVHQKVLGGGGAFVAQ